jgi:hypothetical protein
VAAKKLSRGDGGALRGDPVATLEAARAVHTKSIARFGGSMGRRECAVLEPTLVRPRCEYSIDLIREAAALGESLSQNYSHVNGIKPPLVGLRRIRVAGSA